MKTNIRFGFLRLTLALAITLVTGFNADIHAKAQDKKGKAKAEIEADPGKAGGEYYVYEFNDEAVSKAPKGYKPFYISHIGRHGARYALKDEIYESLRDILNKAFEDNKLTEKGKELRERYEKFYPNVAYRGGDLTQKGQEQLRTIAGTMYSRFPEVFKGETNVEAISTAYPRVILSMYAFLGRLAELDNDISFHTDAGRSLTYILHPNVTINPNLKEKAPISKKGQRSAEKFRDATIDTKALACRFFTDYKYIEKNYGAWSFIADLRSLAVSSQCLDSSPTSDDFSDMFTKDELYKIWEVQNYNGYLLMGQSPVGSGMGSNMYSIMLEDIIRKAEKDMATGKVNMRLRFSHDTAIMSMLSFMNLNGLGVRVSEPKDVADKWASYTIAMGSNLQLIFYRSKKKSDILVKVLFNGAEAKLPINEAAAGFYKWDDFRKHYLKEIERVRPMVEKYLKSEKIYQD